MPAEAMAAHTPLRGWIEPGVARELFAAAGQDLDQLSRQAMQADFVPVALAGVALSAELALLLHNRPVRQLTEAEIVELLP